MKKIYDMILFKLKKTFRNFNINVDTIFITTYILFITAILYYLFFVMLK